MGWDIVAIGTNHKLPIENPIETAKMLAPMLDGTIHIGYYQKLEYNNIENSIRRADKYEWEEISSFDTGRKGGDNYLDIKDECYRRIFAQLKSSIESVRFIGDCEKRDFLDCIYGEPYDIYELISHDFGIYIYKEIIEFSVIFNGRWVTLERAFKQPYIGPNKQYLDDFRKHIYNQLKICGCDCAYYFPDQSYGEWLYEKLNLSTENWIRYLKSRQYLRDENQEMSIFNVTDYVCGKKILQDSENVICFIDDFEDLKAEKI